MWNWPKLRGQPIKVWTRGGAFFSGTLTETVGGMISLVDYEAQATYEVLTAAVEAVTRYEVLEGGP
jgi:hypothetical protein